MERRVLLALFLAFLVLYVWQTVVVKPPVKPPQDGNAPAAAVTPSGSTPPGAAATPGGATPANAAGEAAATPPVPTAPAAAALVTDAAERDVRVETRDIIAVFTNRGARLKSWRLKHYFDQKREPQELVLPLANQPLPFTLRTPDDATSATLTNALYTVAGAPAESAALSATDL